MQCSNNAKQIGLAMHNYHDVHKKFPKNIFGGPDIPASSNGGVMPLPYHHTWLTALLPFMEQQNLYDRINFQLPAWGQPHVSALVPGLQCPSDGNFSNTTECHGIAWTDYAGSQGYHWWSTAQFGPWDPWLGFGWDRNADVSGLFAPGMKWRSLAGIKDGTSNTVIIAEKDTRGYYGGPQLTTGTGIPRSSLPDSVFCAAFVAFAHAGWATSENGSSFQEVDGSGQKAAGTWFRAAPHAFEPTYLTAWGMNTEWPGACSSHAGSVIMCIKGDGSVAPVSDSITWFLWVNLNGYADGYTSAIPD
jgi:hypothetical protein